jgi:hypothetical protein
MGAHSRDSESVQPVVSVPRHRCRSLGCRLGTPGEFRINHRGMQSFLLAQPRRGLQLWTILQGASDALPISDATFRPDKVKKALTRQSRPRNPNLRQRCWPSSQKVFMRLTILPMAMDSEGSCSMVLCSLPAKRGFGHCEEDDFQILCDV